MIRIYNTLSGKKEILKLFDTAPARGEARQRRQGKKLRLFVCGPTVYDASHIGHARTYLAFDMIVKYLKEKNFAVFYLQNITDIDDKIIDRAKETGITPSKLAHLFEKEYLKDIKSLKINSVTKYAKATLYIKEIIDQIKQLLKRGYAYQIEDGVYYDISKFKNYGKLSRRSVLQAEDATSRIDRGIGKKNKGDFCLWKISKPGEPKWQSPWGWGRPGWHIEDTAITQKFFGPQYDIHGGAEDLKFPHHEAEIAQMEAISGKKPMVKYWLHTGFLKVNEKKMSKSSGNFITIKDFIEKHSPRLLRFLVLKNHYRSPIDYSEKSVLQAERELEHIDEFIEKLKKSDFPKTPGVNEKTPGVKAKKSDSLKFQTNFWKAMEEDFNTPKAVAIIFELMHWRNYLNTRDTLKFLRQIDKFFNFIFWPRAKTCLPAGKGKIKLLNLVKQRQEYRKMENWQKADEIRKKILELGWFIEDTKEGSKLKKIK